MINYRKQFKRNKKEAIKRATFAYAEFHVKALTEAFPLCAVAMVNAAISAQHMAEVMSAVHKKGRGKIIGIVTAK